MAAFLLFVAGVGNVLGAEPKLLSHPDTERNADRALVFIHGLLGSAEASFGNWPAIIAGDDTELPGHGKLSDLAVYAVDYEADFQSQAKLDEVAIGVSRDLAASQLFKRHRHVWLVAHSMGGLILKRTLTQWVQERKDVLVDRILGIGLLGVPSAGAPLADLAEEFGVDRIANTFGWNGKLLEDLITDSGSYLVSQQASWEGFKRARETQEERRLTPVIHCGFEQKPQLSGSDSFLGRMKDAIVNSVIDTTIVPRLFSGGACHETRGFAASHTDLIKPPNAADSIHGWLRNLIVISITQGSQELRAAYTTGPPSPTRNGNSNPVPYSVYDRVMKFNEGLETPNLDRNTGLPANPERIVFADPQSEKRAKSLVLRSGDFEAYTLLEMWKAAASKNSCLRVGHSINRLTITLAIDDKFVSCPGGAVVCARQICN